MYILNYLYININLYQNVFFVYVQVHVKKNILNDRKISSYIRKRQKQKKKWKMKNEKNR